MTNQMGWLILIKGPKKDKQSKKEIILIMIGDGSVY